MTERFDIQSTPIDGLMVLRRKPIQDRRGSLVRMFCRDELAGLLNGRRIAQVNHTTTGRPGVVRGMHYQHPPHAEVKIVSCVRGSVYDVAVDLRKNSPSFLKWHGELLTEDNNAALFIPEGFAHGFQTLQADCELLYFHTQPYVREAEDGLNATDPCLGIEWKTEISERSPRDESHPLLSPAYRGIEI